MPWGLPWSWGAHMVVSLSGWYLAVSSASWKALEVCISLLQARLGLGVEEHRLGRLGGAARPFWSWRLAAPCVLQLGGIVARLDIGVVEQAPGGSNRSDSEALGCSSSSDSEALCSSSSSDREALGGLSRPCLVSVWRSTASDGPEGWQLLASSSLVVSL